MDVIPVLDLMGEQVVRGIAGKRETYAPVRSCLTTSAAPREIAHALRDELGLNRLYVADLDGITVGAPHWPELESLAADGFELRVDAGLRNAAGAELLLACGVSHVIAALETLPGPLLLDELIDHCGPERVIFSLDLMSGGTLGDLSAWETSDPAAIAAHAISLGVTSMIVLDLASVGMAGGVSTRDLCRRLRRQYPDLTLITGGGVRDGSDLRELWNMGVDGVLVASALHNAAIGRREIESVSDGNLKSP